MGRRQQHRRVRPRRWAGRRLKCVRRRWRGGGRGRGRGRGPAGSESCEDETHVGAAAAAQEKTEGDGAARGTDTAETQPPGAVRALLLVVQVHCMPSTHLCWSTHSCRSHTRYTRCHLLLSARHRKSILFFGNKIPWISKNARTHARTHGKGGGKGDEDEDEDEGDGDLDTGYYGVYKNMGKYEADLYYAGESDPYN